jgi:CBS domain-containing protein
LIAVRFGQEVPVDVRDAMSATVLTIGPAHTLRQAARLMAERKVGAAVVLDPDSEGPGILTERDVLESLGAGQDPDVEVCGDHLTREAVTALPQWDLGRAATAMVNGGFRHLVVSEGHEVIGIISVRDIVRVWSQLSSLTGA